jgi:MFS family permease
MSPPQDEDRWNMVRLESGTPEIGKRWLLLLAAVVVLFSVHGIPTFALPFLYEHMIEDTGWTREQVTLLASFKFATGAVAVLFFGIAADLVGDRRAVLIAVLSGGLAMMSFLFVDSLWKLYLSGAALGLVAGATVVGVKTLLARLFETQPGGAIGIAVTGTSAAGLVVPLAVTILLSTVDWRSAVALLSLPVWLAAAPLMMFAMRSIPAPPAVARPSASLLSARYLADVRSLIGCSDFWRIALSLFLVGAVDMGLTQHQVLYLRNDTGLAPAFVALLVTAFAATTIISKLSAGFVYDKISLKGIILGYLLLALNPVAALVVIGPMTAVFFIAMRGVAHGALITDVPIFAKHVFGHQHLGLLIGLFTSAMQFGFALGPWLLGSIYARFGSYSFGFVLFGVLAGLAALLTARLKPTAWLAQRELLSTKE